MSTPSSTPIPTSRTSVRWPANKFYWAELDGLGWTRSGPLPEAMLPILAEAIPVPLERVHAVGQPLDDGRLLVCACERDALQQIEPGWIELKPEALPAGLGAGIDCERLNLLVGDFEPMPIRSARRTRHLSLAGTAAICMLALAIGLMRRASTANATAVQASQASTALLLGFTSDRRDEGMAQHLQGMRTIVDVARRAKIAPDAAAGFEALLTSWPAQTPAKPQSVLVSNDGISLGVIVEGDPAPFLKAFTPPPSFVLDEPRITSVGPITRLAIHLSPRAQGGTSK